MIKNLRNLLLVLLMLSGVHLFAQTSVGEIDGKVTDEGGEPIIGAIVHVEQGGVQKTGAATNYDGEYSLTGLTPGRYDLVVQYSGKAKVTITNVTIAPSGGISYQNIKMVEATRELVEVVVRYREPLVDPGKPNTNKRLRSEDMENMATRNTADFAALGTSVVQAKSGGALNIGGARSQGTLYVIDGIMVSGSTGVNLPAGSIDQLEVMTSGIPAKYGDATGGVVNLTTKNATSVIKGNGLIEHSVDGYNNNRANLTLSGPFLSRMVNGLKKPIIGFFVTGEYQYNKDNAPSLGGNYVVKEAVRKNLEQNPIVASPSDNGSLTFKPAAEYLTANDFQNVKARVNAKNQSGTILGKLNYEVVPGTTLTFGASLVYNNGVGYSRGSSYLAPDAMRNSSSYTGRTYLRFQQRLGKGRDSSSAIQNAFYTVQADYQTDYSKSQDPNHKDNLFMYGYVGKFTEHLAPVYSIGIDTGINKVGIVTTGYGYTSPVTYERSDANPLLANYTSSYYNLGGTAPFSMNNNPLSGIYLRNGDGPNSVYSLFSNVGSYNGAYQYQKADQVSVNIDASFAYKAKNVTHAVEFGIYYQQRTERYYGLSASGLWGLMRLLTHNAVNSSDLDKSNPVYIVNGKEYTKDQIKNGDVIFGPTDTVKYVSLYNSSATPAKGGFDYNLRTKLGLNPKGNDYLQPDAYDPSIYSVGMFTADELLLSYTNPLVTYYGYDYTGKAINGQVNYNDFWKTKDADGNYTRPIGAYRPSYLAGYISDQIRFKQILFTLGLRVERFDNNTKVFRDPYSLYAERNVASVDGGQNFLNGGSHPSNIGSDYIVYVNSNNSSTPSIIGYRNGDTWYDPFGKEIENPQVLKQYTSTDPQPYLQKNAAGGTVASITDTAFNAEASFKDYKPIINVLPRISFSFPISPKAVFFAHYDIIAQRPRVGLGYGGLNGGLTGVGAYVSPMDYIGLVQSPGSIIANADLKMPKLIDYEVGFQQSISDQSAITISAFYKERKNEIQLRPYTFAYPYTYYTYKNVDFSTTKGLALQYDLRRTNHLALSIGYTLQYASGTGSSATSGNEGGASSVAANGLLSYLISANVPNLLFSTALDYDSRHIINVNPDYRFLTGEGPVIGGKHILENAGLNLLLTARSGEPYTKLANPQTLQSGIHNTNSILGLINTSRLPWHYMVNVKVDKTFRLDFSKKGEDGNVKGHIYGLQAYVYVQNLLNHKDITSVYRYSGTPDNDGFLTSPGGVTTLRNQTSAQSFSDLYTIFMQNPDNLNYARRIYVGVNFNF